MRGEVTQIRSIGIEEYQEKGKNIRLPSLASIDRPIYVEILSKTILKNSQDLFNLFHPQKEQIRCMWIPGRSGIKDAEEEFSCFSHERDWYSIIFEEAYGESRLVVMYRFTKRDRDHAQKRRDEFTFRSEESSLILTDFSIRGDNFGKYKFDPQFQQSRWEDRLLGVKGFTEDLL